jgi:homogentisate 1,2-dioxygenase
MFESRYRFIPTNFALQSPALDTDYADCWAGLNDQFKA